MAARTGQSDGQPQYSLPKLTPEEIFVQKKQGEFIQKDVVALNTLQVERPFTDLKDAVARLLPFHLFNAIDASEADLDETPDHRGKYLMSSRTEAWQELCLSKVNDLRRRAENAAAQVATLQQISTADALSGNRPLDRYAVAKLQHVDLRGKVEAEKAMLRQLQQAMPKPNPIPQAAAVPAPTAATIRASAAGATSAGAHQVLPNLAGGLTAQQLAVLRGLPPAQQQLQLQLLAAAQQQQAAQQQAAQQQVLQQYAIQQLLQQQQQQQAQQAAPQQQQLAQQQFAQLQVQQLLQLQQQQQQQLQQKK